MTRSRAGRVDVYSRHTLVVLLFVAMFLSFGPVTVSAESHSESDLVRQYNRLLKKSFSGAVLGQGAPLRASVRELTGILSALLAAEIDDPDVLQHLAFVPSYEALFALEKKCHGVGAHEQASWKNTLVALDRRAEGINGFRKRPTALWLLERAKGIPSEPTAPMVRGAVVEEEGIVWIDSQAKTCGGEERRCRKLRYMVLKMLVPGVFSPERARDLFLEVPGDKANTHVHNYWEVPLGGQEDLFRRNYMIKPFPGYAGTMEHYCFRAFRDVNQVIMLEQNARVGKYVFRTDTAAAFVRSPGYGTVVALVMSGDYFMEGFFYFLMGRRRIAEPAKSLYIIRRHMVDPGQSVEDCISEGLEDFRKQKEQAKRMENACGEKNTVHQSVLQGNDFRQDEDAGAAPHEPGDPGQQNAGIL